jgi:hypothetical protein
VDPVPDPLLFFSGSPGNRTRASGSVARNSDHQAVEADHTPMLIMLGYLPSVLGFTQPLTEMSTRNIKIIMFLGSKVRRVRRADNLNIVCEPIV